MSETPLDLIFLNDPLQFMIEKQRALHDRVTEDGDLGWKGLADAMGRKYDRYATTPRPPVSDVTLCLADNLQMMAVEAHEALQDIPWKKHKRDYGRELREEERELVLEELVDIQHFLLNSFRLLGVTSSREIAQRYLSKNTVNHRRQDTKY